MDKLQEFKEGETESFPASLIGDVFGGTVSFDITEHIDPKIEIEVEIWLSNDNGNTWDFGGSCKRFGAIAYHPDTGKLLTTAGFSCSTSNPRYFTNNKFDKYQPKWQSPLIKTVTKVTGGKLNTKITPDAIKSIRAQADVPDLHHSIAYVQSTSAAGSNVQSITTSAITTTSGNLGVLEGGWFDSPGTPTGVFTDSKSNTWTTSIAEHREASRVGAMEGYNANLTGGASHTFTLTIGASSPYPTIAYIEISGHAASPFDKSGTVDDQTGTTHTTSSTGTLSQAKEFIIGTGILGSQGTASIAAPWTQIEYITHDGTHEGIIIGYQIVNSTSALTFTWDTSANNPSEAPGHISTWKEAASAATYGHGSFRQNNLRPRVFAPGLAR